MNRLPESREPLTFNQLLDRQLQALGLPDAATLGLIVEPAELPGMPGVYRVAWPRVGFEMFSKMGTVGLVARAVKAARGVPRGIG